MFVAIDQFGSKVHPINTEEEELRLLSKSKLLFCPECEKPVIFASGEQVSAHFKHVHNSDCTYDSEPETEEHVNGKIAIYDWLLNLYPDAKIELEYKIQETNQRADVIALLPSGERIAFEFQCSKITGSAWKERHKLYKSAGISDVWILGDSVHKYWQTGGKEDRTKHQLVSLASDIYKEKKALFFLNPKTKIFRALYEHKYVGWHSDTIIKIDEEFFEVKEAKMYKRFIGIDAIRDDYKDWYEEQIELERQARKEKEEYKRQMKRQEEEWKERSRLYHQHMQLKADSKKEYLLKLRACTLDQLKKEMNQKEEELFEKLLKKHNYNDDNFPGIFKVHTKVSYMFYTPSELWQLWIYDKYIHRKEEPNKKVWIPNIQEQMYTLRQKGVFRFKTTHGDNHFSFAIYDYFKRLNMLDIVKQLGSRNGKYQKIKYNELPLYLDKKLHENVAYYLSIDDESTPLQIIESYQLYLDMLVKFDSEKAQLTVDDRIKLKVEYIHNLIKGNPNLINEWESTFVEKIFDLFQGGYSLSEKQLSKMKKIIEKVEKELNYSLIPNK